MKNILSVLQGFDGFADSPHGIHAIFGEGIKNFPIKPAIRDEEAFSENKKAAMEEAAFKVTTRCAIGENDRAVLEALYLKRGASYFTEYGFHIGEVKLDKSTAFAVIAPYADSSGKLLISGFVQDDKTGRTRNISLKKGTFEAAAILLAVASRIKFKQEENGSTELVDTVNDVLNGTDLEFAPYRFSGILYYDFFDKEVTFGPNEDASIIEKFEKADIGTLGQIKETTFGSYESKILSEEALAEEHGSADVEFMHELNQKLSETKLSIEDVKENYGFLSLSSDFLKKTLTDISKFITLNKRTGNSKKKAMILIGPPGTGKSTLPPAAAYLMNLPFRSYVASGESLSPTDIIANIVPVIDVTLSDIERGNSYIPDKSFIQENYGIDFMDIVHAPLVAYKSIYGYEYAGEFVPDPEEMFNELAKRQVEAAFKNKGTGKGREGFMMVLTEAGKTLMYGGLVEAQEINMVANPNDLSYYYRILQEGLFSLPTGEQLPVHPDAYMVFSMNASETFVRELPPAFKTRVYKTILFQPTTAEVMAKQAMESFTARGYKLDYAQVRDMAIFMEKLKEFADTDELASLRQLDSWITAAMDGESLFDSCESTVINIASIDDTRRSKMIGMLEASPFYSGDIVYKEIKDEKLSV